jgi:hypothetical protein
MRMTRERSSLFVQTYFVADIFRSIVGLANIEKKYCHAIAIDARADIYSNATGVVHQGHSFVALRLASSRGVERTVLPVQGAD